VKQLFFVLTIIIVTGMPSNAQTDIEVAKLLIGQSFDKIDSILTANKITYYITGDEKEEATVYIQKNQSVRMWKITHHNTSRKEITETSYSMVFVPNGIAEIYIRYKHNALNDLRDFFNEIIPKENPAFIVEKSMGIKMSDIKITLK